MMIVESHILDAPKETYSGHRYLLITDKTDGRKARSRRSLYSSSVGVAVVDRHANEYILS